MDKENLLKLINTCDENEHLEFKEAKSGFSIDGGRDNSKNSIYAYCVALGNEGGGKLILGVTDKKPRTIVGTSVSNIDGIKTKLFELIKLRVNIYEFYFNENNKVIVICIPSRNQGSLLRFYGTPLMRVGEQLHPMDDHTMKNILNEGTQDFSSEIVSGANISDVDSSAVEYLKVLLQKERPKEWDEKYRDLDNISILQKLNLINNKKEVTVACLILFGDYDCIQKFDNIKNQIKIQWTYDTGDNLIVDPRIRKFFDAPLLPKIEEIWRYIDSRNDPLVENDLFNGEQKQFDEISIRELLVNSIVHRDWQDKDDCPWIVINQNKNSIKFSNSGEYWFDSFSDLINHKKRHYRNHLLTEVCRKIGLAEQELGGILDKVIKIQISKGLPMPVYSKANGITEAVLNTKVIDKNLAKLLLNNLDVEIKDAILLDSISRNKNKIGVDISKSEADVLKKKGYIEIRGGRYQSCYISKKLSVIINQKSKYVILKGYTKQQRIDCVLNFIDEFGKIELKDLDQMFPDMTKDQKVNLLLREMCNKKKLIKRVTEGNSKKGFYVKNLFDNM